MENLTVDSWMMIGLCGFIIVASIAMALHIVKKYPPEPIPTPNDEPEVEEILDDVMEDD